ncbi:MAG: hypothetical protein H0W86_12715 [Armatimonadetes bacterium]|nr:hypothetical protein [Armatimonadota bacterium]
MQTAEDILNFCERGFPCNASVPAAIEAHTIARKMVSHDPTEANQEKMIYMLGAVRWAATRSLDEAAQQKQYVDSLPVDGPDKVAFYAGCDELRG